MILFVRDPVRCSCDRAFRLEIRPTMSYVQIRNHCVRFCTKPLWSGVHIRNDYVCVRFSCFTIPLWAHVQIKITMFVCDPVRCPCDRTFTLEMTMLLCDPVVVRSD